METLNQLEEIVQKLKRTLPAQAPLKDFIATNTLYAFQTLPFHRGLQEAHHTLGVKTYLDLSEYQTLFKEGKIRSSVLEWIVSKQNPEHLKSLVLEDVHEKLSKLDLDTTHNSQSSGRLRDLWKKEYGINLITHVHPVLFRHLGHFLDQGISFLPVPFYEKGFWGSLQELERQSWISLFRGGKKSRAHHFLTKTPWEALENALNLLVGDTELFEQYLFEMLQEHPGWSGLTAVLEDHPEHLNFPRTLTFHEVLAFELLLELDYLDDLRKKTNVNWSPLTLINKEGKPHQAEPNLDSNKQLLEILHEAWEWTFYQDLLTGLKENQTSIHTFKSPPSAQVFFCIDDRCCSLRRHLEELNPEIETFGTPGFFGVEFFYKGETERFPVKLCPAPLKPQFLIKGTTAEGENQKYRTDFLLSRLSHTLFGGWLISQTLGLFSAIRLIMNIFSPALSPKVAASFQHTDDRVHFKFLRESEEESENGLKLGFNRSEMAERVFGLLNSCGLYQQFSPLIVMLGHGSSTVNNPHYAAYDCGACSGRPGSINARIFCAMANDPEVRELVKQKGITIPNTTRFVPALYDTTRDEVFFYDQTNMPVELGKRLEKLKTDLRLALVRTAKERSRRFDDIPLNTSPENAHRKLQRKSVSIFEPRQEFTHSGNAACIIGPRSLTRHLFLDRRSFLNSYDPKVDPEGDILCNILKAAVPVCGGINLQYFFSRIDNEKMGSGTKLPHNVVGLFSVANGTEGDLRPGLPQQMVEWHEPLRLLIVAYQEPAIALKAAQKIPATFEWIKNEWVKYGCLSPSTGRFFVFESNEMKPFDFFGPSPHRVENSLELVSRSRDYLPISIIGGAR